MSFSETVVKRRIPILIITLLLMIPAVLGMIRTRVNYDMLDYLPADMDTVIGQDELMKEFGKGAFSILIFEDMPDKDVDALLDKIRELPHVDSVLWYSSLADLSVPREILPDRIYRVFNTDHSTAAAIFFDSSTSADVTMDAIRQIRSIVGEQCFVSGMSALVTDLKDLCEKEEPNDDCSQPREQFLPGRDLLYYESAFRGPAAGGNYGLFDLPLEQLQREAPEHAHSRRRGR